MKNLVFLDVETTGLDLGKDEIIEIGMISVENMQVECELSFIIRPTSLVPENVVELTGISNQMLEGAPIFSSVMPEISEFIKDKILIGHNIQFDIGFLNKQGLKIDNEFIDTYELSLVLLPTQKRYSLRSLGQTLGIGEKNTHRALDDALLTYKVFLELFGRASSIPSVDLKLIGDLISGSGNKVDPFWDEIFRVKGLGENQKSDVKEYVSSILNRMTETKAVNLNNSLNQPTDDRFSRIFPFNGIRFIEIENTPETQRALCQSISESVMKSDKKLLISFSDMDALRQSTDYISNYQVISQLSEEYHQPTSYLCPRRLEFLLTLQPYDRKVTLFLLKIIVWKSKSNSFILDELSYSGFGNTFTDEVSWSKEICTNKCDYFNKCPVVKHLESIQKARILFTTHKDLLLLSDLKTGGDEYVIMVNEAWTLSENWLAAIRGNYSLRVILTKINKLRCLLIAVGKSFDNDHDIEGVSLASLITNQCSRLLDELTALFDLFALALLLTKKRINYDHNQQHIRILESLRRGDGFQEIKSKWSSVHETIASAIENLDILKRHLEKHDMAEMFRFETEIVRMVLVSYKSTFDELFLAPTLSNLFWADIQTHGDNLNIIKLPSSISTYYSELFAFSNSLIFISPTIIVNKSNDYIRKKLQIPDSAVTETLDFSQKDCREAVLFYWIPESHRFDETNRAKSHLLSSLLTMCNHASRSALVLFGSSSLMHSVYNKMVREIELTNYRVVVADQENAHEIESEVMNGNSLLVFSTFNELKTLNLASDLFPIVILTKLPFLDMALQTSIFLSLDLKDTFQEYSLPEAVRLFRHSFNLLAKSRNSKSTLLVLDSRIKSADYGKYFLRDLPLCTVESGSFLHFIKSSLDWFAMSQE